jgi:hypothetical protein
MAISVSSATHVQAQTAVQPAAAHQPAPAPKPQPPVTDTVQISAAAKALQETVETSAQIAREASSGDVQAQRLQAKEAAARAITK